MLKKMNERIKDS